MHLYHRICVTLTLCEKSGVQQFFKNLFVLFKSIFIEIFLQKLYIALKIPYAQCKYFYSSNNF